jgi:hypothetical protein
VPDGGTSEAVDDWVNDSLVGAGIEELTRGASGCFHLFGGALADAFGLTVAPDLGGEDSLVALVDGIADRLPDEVVGEGVASQAIGLKLFPEIAYVAIFVKRTADLEMVTPAGEFDAVVAHLFDKREKFV